MVECYELVIDNARNRTASMGEAHKLQSWAKRTECKLARLWWTAEVMGCHLLYLNKIRILQSFKLHKEIILKISFTLLPDFGVVNIYVFCIYLRTNSDLCHLQHKLIGFYNRDEKCLLRGTNWVFKYSGLRFVCKGLIFMCFVFILEQTATCATYSIN